MTDRYTDAEQLLIGRLLLGGEYYQVAPLVSVGHFQSMDAARVFAAIAALCEAGLPVNRLGLQAQLGSEYPRLRPWLADLYTQGQVSGPAAALAEVVREGYHRRRALALAERLATAAYDDTADITATQAAVAGELLHGRADRQQEAVGAVA